MIRPHPAFWRFVFGLVTCYTLFMVYLLFQSADGARQTLKVQGGSLECCSVQRRVGSGRYGWQPLPEE